MLWPCRRDLPREVTGGESTFCRRISPMLNSIVRRRPFGMWSPLAEQLVSRLIAALPADQLDPTRTHAVRLRALPIGGSMWADYYLRPNGQVVIVGEDFDNPEVDSVYSDWRRVLPVLVWGAQRYPELRELLPVRGPGAVDCQC